MGETWLGYQKRCWRHFRSRHLWNHVGAWLPSSGVSVIAGLLYFHFHPKGTAVDWETIGVSAALSLGIFLFLSVVQFFVFVPSHLSAEDNKAWSKRESSLTATIEGQSTEIVNLKSGLPDLEVEIKEIALGLAGAGGTAVFIWVKLFPKRPGKTGATYSLSVVHRGRAVPLTPLFDIDDWQYVKRNEFPHPGEAFGIQEALKARKDAIALPTELESGVYAEGWLHFIAADMSDSFIGKSDLRLRIDTTVGKLEVETPGVSLPSTTYSMKRR